MDIIPQITALELTNPLLIPAEEEALVPIAARFPYTSFFIFLKPRVE